MKIEQTAREPKTAPARKKSNYLLLTAYERDIESSLDFAQARYYNSAHGRFTTVDPLAASASQSDPQTFNRYVYVRNSPLVMTDPTGMIGDYFSYNGTYLGHDDIDDQRVYFATEIGRHGNDVDLDRRTIRETTLAEVFKAQDRAVAITPGTDNTIQELSQEVTQGVTDGFTGIAKGVGNAPAVALNGATGCIFNCGVQGAYFQGSNPLAVPLPFAYNNAREADYGSASSTGTLLGLGVAGAAVAPSAAAPSVVPAAESANATNFIYSSRVLVRSAQESGPYHNFPMSFDSQIVSNGTRTGTSNFVMYRQPGTINGRSGVFEIGARPSASGRTEVITHRFFRP
ncbi:MAG: RHS repeat-associated core domain-containing protein [Pyrinomonadaceae bacterium]